MGFDSEGDTLWTKYLVKVGKQCGAGELKALQRKVADSSLFMKINSLSACIGIFASLVVDFGQYYESLKFIFWVVSDIVLKVIVCVCFNIVKTTSQTVRLC